MSRSFFKHIQKHPFVTSISRQIQQASIDRVLRQEFFRQRMVEDRMTGLEFREKLTYTRFEPSYLSCEQHCGSLIDELGPCGVINPADIDVLRENQLLYRLQNSDTLLRIQDRKSTRLNSSHRCISYAVFCL